MIADPLFVNEAAGDWKLDATSPCVNKGVDLGYDYRGDHPDIGAHEYWDGGPSISVVPIPPEIARILDELEAKLRELREAIAERP
jgi:hypothetical protein